MLGIKSGRQPQLDNTTVRASPWRKGKHGRPPPGVSERFSVPCSFARRMQDIESDTGYDTLRRWPDGVLVRVSQTAVYDTCRSATAVWGQALASCAVAETGGAVDAPGVRTSPARRHCQVPHVWRHTRDGQRHDAEDERQRRHQGGTQPDARPPPQESNAHPPAAALRTRRSGLNYWPPTSQLDGAHGSDLSRQSRRAVTPSKVVTSIVERNALFSVRRRTRRERRLPRKTPCLRVCASSAGFA